jgi:hypothetical protein
MAAAHDACSHAAAQLALVRQLLEGRVALSQREVVAVMQERRAFAEVRRCSMHLPDERPACAEASRP